MSSAAVCVIDDLVQEQTVACGPESRTLRAMIKRLAEHYHTPISRQAGLEFYVFVKKWKEDTIFLSSITDKSVHPAYQRIIGMGEKAVPFLLRELERNPDDWFWALNAITGADPVKEQNRGRIEQMTEDWLSWAKENGYEW